MFSLGEVRFCSSLQKPLFVYLSATFIQEGLHTWPTFFKDQLCVVWDSHGISITVPHNSAPQLEQIPHHTCHHPLSHARSFDRGTDCRACPLDSFTKPGWISDPARLVPFICGLLLSLFFGEHLINLCLLDLWPRFIFLGTKAVGGFYAGPSVFSPFIHCIF